MIIAVYSASSFTLFTISDNNVCVCAHMHFVHVLVGFNVTSDVMSNLSHSDSIQNHMGDILWLSNWQNC